MPNGYRRGGQVTRNGRTFQRRGTTYRMPTRTKAVVAIAGVAVGCAALGGGPLAAHPVVLTGVIVGVVAIIAGAAFIKNGGAHRLRRKAVYQVKRSGKRAVRKARKKWTASHPEWRMTSQTDHHNGAISSTWVRSKRAGRKANATPGPSTRPTPSREAREGRGQGRLLS